MRTILALIVLLLAPACGGGGGSTTSAQPPSGGGTNPTPTPPPPVPVPRGTYQSTPHLVTVAAGIAVTPIGDITQSLVVENGGVCRMELPGWQHVHAAIYADATGALLLGTGATLTNANGVTVPLTLTGTLVGNRMIGTTNGGSFDVTLTGIQDTPVDIATKAGAWISTASSNGQVMRLTIPAILNSSWNISADAYANSTDAAAKTNALGVYTGTMSWSDSDITHVRNCLNIGFAWDPTGPGGILPGGVWGLAYFDASGNLIVMTASTTSSAEGSGQLSAVFVKE